MPVVSTLGAMSSRGFGEFNQQTAANYIEDVFSTYLYTGTGSTQTITNGIDLSTKGGLLWTKARSTASTPPAAANWHWLYDSSRSNFGDVLFSNDTSASSNVGNITPLTTGFTTSSYAGSNQSGVTYASWTFRKQPKFFDVVTYTGNGANRTITHNLGSVPGMIIIKRTDTTAAWAVYHSALANTEYLVLNTTAAKATDTTYWNSTTPTSTVFSLGTATDVNANGGTYVAYLYASNAGGFGADGSQNVISCGSFSAASTTTTVNLGYEPQFVLIKNASSSGQWYMVDVMRGMSNTNIALLQANLAASESAVGLGGIIPTATGFIFDNALFGYTVGNNIIYMAIRRGPMRTPTSGTSVFSTYKGSIDNAFLSTNFPVDMFLSGYRNDAGNKYSSSRLTNRVLSTNTTDAEINSLTLTTFQSNTGLDQPGLYGNGFPFVYWSFQRAPGFFDVVCYTGTGSARTVSHNLGVAPELIIIKKRNTTGGWPVYSASLATSQNLVLNQTAAANTSSPTNLYWNDTAPTASVFSLGPTSVVNGSGDTFVAYLFASCPGVSKVGSYTGTGATQTISCGFTGGARYVLIKRTDSTGDWWVWDTARGMVSGTDPRLAYNSINAETNANWVYTTTGGFQIVTSDATVNANGGTYLFLAIS